jgi:hypothetical protein
MRVLTGLSVVNRDGELASLPKLIAFKISGDHLLNGILEVRRVVGDNDRQKADREHRLALAVGDLALIETARSPDLAKAGDKPVDSLGWASDDEEPGTVVKADTKAAAFRQVLVGRTDVLLEIGEREAGNGQHGGGDAHASIHAVLDDRRLERDDREGLLATETAEEEPSETLLGVLEEGLEGVRCRDCDSGHDTLRVAGSTGKVRTHLAR